MYRCGTKSVGSQFRGQSLRIGFDNFEMQVVRLNSAGLAQWSPLSPILLPVLQCGPGGSAR
jgi:hypothetical protein